MLFLFCLPYSGSGIEKTIVRAVGSEYWTAASRRNWGTKTKNWKMTVDWKKVCTPLDLEWWTAAGQGIWLEECEIEK